MSDNPFKYVNLINGGTSTDQVQSDYNKFITTRFFSYHLDTVLIANFLNTLPSIDDQMHFDFLKSCISPKKRFAKWAKPQTHKRVTTISKFFAMPMAKAYEVQDLFSDEEIEQIDNIMQTKETK